MAERDWGRDIVNVSRGVDVATVMGALMFGGLAPGLAAAAIEFSAVTLAGGEIVDAGLKRRKK